MQKTKTEPNTPARKVTTNRLRGAASGPEGTWRIRDTPSFLSPQVTLRPVVIFSRPFDLSNGTSAAQNGHVINSCSQCGSILYEYGRACPFCATPSVGSHNTFENETVSVGVAASQFAAAGSSSSGGAVARTYVDDDCDYAPADMESESFERPPLVRAAAAGAGAAVKRAPAAEPPLVVRASAAGTAIGRMPAKDAPVVRAPAVAPKAPPRRPPEPEPEWRQEVARRLDAYRTRHPRPEEEAQAGLPFSLHLDPIEEFEQEPDLETKREPEPKKETARPSARVTRPRASERVEISIQPELDFNASRDDRSRPQTALVPVASIEDRRWAGMLDATFLLATFAGFLGLFRSLGGDILLHKVDAPVYLGAFFLLYAQYFALFTTFAGSTPGMQLRGLYVVRLDGYLPDTTQLVWRSFGYVLSAGTLMLGFLWALWDEEHFTWQDRISQTYVTSGTPLGINESALGQSQQTLGR